jgi:hypothetical protein
MDAAAGLIYRENGEPAPSVVGPWGTYAPDDPVVRIHDANGRDALVFPEPLERQQRKRLPDAWPGWHLVELDFVRAIESFVRIDGLSDVLAFAQRFGPLWACSLHPFPCLSRGLRDDVHGHAWLNPEPLDWWFGMVGALRAVLVAGERTRAGERVRPEDWHALGLPTDLLGATSSAEVDRLFLGAAVNVYLETFGCTLVLRPGVRAFALGLDAGLGFVPGLWQQAASLLAGGRALAVCSGCGNPYLRHQRAAKAGQRNYCSSCASHSARQRLWRAAGK